MAISTFLINTCVKAILLLIGTSLIERDRLTEEILLAFMLYQGQLQSEVFNLLQSYSSLIRSSGAGDKVFALLDRTPPPPGTGSPTVLARDHETDDSEQDRASFGVELRELHFQYPTRRSSSSSILKNFSLNNFSYLLFWLTPNFYSTV